MFDFAQARAATVAALAAELGEVDSTEQIVG
jgi:hypothetical protein